MIGFVLGVGVTIGAFWLVRKYRPAWLGYPAPWPTTSRWLGGPGSTHSCRVGRMDGITVGVLVLAIAAIFAAVRATLGGGD